MWACSICGPHPESDGMWCASGCGRDYNRMYQIPDDQLTSDQIAKYTTRQKEQLTMVQPASQPALPTEKPKKEYPLIPDGTKLVCLVKDVKENTPPWPDADLQVSFQFQVVEGFNNPQEYYKSTIWGNTYPSWNDKENCKLRIWAQEIWGVDYIPTKDDIGDATSDYGTLKNRLVYVTVVRWKSEKTGKEGMSAGTLERFLGEESNEDGPIEFSIQDNRQYPDEEDW